MKTLSSIYTFLAQFHLRSRCLGANKVLKVSWNVIKSTCFGWCGLHQGYFRPRTSHVLMLFFLPLPTTVQALWWFVVQAMNPDYFSQNKLKTQSTFWLKCLSKTIFILISYDKLKNRNMSFIRGGKNSPHITATSCHRSKNPHKANQWGVSECMCYNLRPLHCH